jgi:ribosomal protein L11 methyltransferase
VKDYDTIRVEITVPPSAAESAAFVLAEFGGGSLALEESDDRSSVRVVANLDPRSFDARTVASEISRSLGRFDELEDARVSARRELIPDYAERMRQRFTHFAMAPGLVVVPSWESYEPEAGERIIGIDPGMAFGTGLHETTRLCAGHIAELAPGASSLIDVGTGSGILAIAARLLGIGDICAIENDADALEVARANCIKNGCEDIRLLPDISESRGRFDIAAANILLGTLVELRLALVERVAPGGSLVLSGITHEQERDIMDAFGAEMEHVATTRDGEWSAMLFRGRA